MAVNVCHLGFFSVGTNFVLLVGETHYKPPPNTISVVEFLTNNLAPELIDEIIYCREGGSVRPVNIFKNQLDIESRNIYSLPTTRDYPVLGADFFYTDFKTLFFYLNNKKLQIEASNADDENYSNKLILNTNYDYAKLRALNNYFTTRLSPPGTPINELIFAYSLLYTFENKILIYHVGAHHSVCLWNWAMDMQDDYNIALGMEIVHYAENVLNKNLANQVLAEFTTTIKNRADVKQFLQKKIS